MITNDRNAIKTNDRTVSHRVLSSSSSPPPFVAYEGVDG